MTETQLQPIQNFYVLQTTSIKIHTEAADLGIKSISMLQ